MTTTTLDNPHTAEASRAKRLKAGTHAVHERLDTRIMAGEPFRDRMRYGFFLRVQYLFHRDIDALYRHPALGVLLSDLEARSRLAAIAQDMTDLGKALPDAEAAPLFDGSNIDIARAFGWLYVAEGSNLGAAFLFKAAALGLGADFGARHLAGHPDGRAQHWREFTAVLDALRLTPEEDARVMAGAQAAFTRFQQLVDATFD